MTDPVPTAVGPALIEMLTDHAPPPDGDCPPPEADTPEDETAAIASLGELNETVAEALPPWVTLTLPGQLVTDASAEGDAATMTEAVASTRRSAITSG
ncbi:MAG: hypothetical protein GY722_10650 [bacterium]|nr:hypothetical protein [bacterium]